MTSYCAVARPLCQTARGVSWSAAILRWMTAKWSAGQPSSPKVRSRRPDLPQMLAQCAVSSLSPLPCRCLSIPYRSSSSGHRPSRSPLLGSSPRPRTPVARRSGSGFMHICKKSGLTHHPPTPRSGRPVHARLSHRASRPASRPLTRLFHGPAG